jgi:hypothetical protein
MHRHEMQQIIIFINIHIYSIIFFLKNRVLQNPSHLVLIGHDFHPLVLSDNLNRHGADWMHLESPLMSPRGGVNRQF